jgi:hypothetical protein
MRRQKTPEGAVQWKSTILQLPRPATCRLTDVITTPRGLAYRIIQSVSEITVPINAGDFRFIGRIIIEHLRNQTDLNPYLRGTIAATVELPDLQFKGLGVLQLNRRGVEISQRSLHDKLGKSRRIDLIVSWAMSSGLSRYRVLRSSFYFDRVL